MPYAAANASVNTPRNPVVPYSRRLGLRVNSEARSLWATDCGSLSGAGICLALAEVSRILLNDCQLQRALVCEMVLGAIIDLNSV